MPLLTYSSASLRLGRGKLGVLECPQAFRPTELDRAVVALCRGVKVSILGLRVQS